MDHIKKMEENIINDLFDKKEIPTRKDFEKKSSVKKIKSSKKEKTPPELDKPKTKSKINFKVLITSLITVYLIGFIGGQFTSMATASQWYLSIKPSITPPDFVFPIVWNILFLLIAISLYLVWTKAKDKREKQEISLAFGINLALNLLWSIFYFGMRSPFLALIELIFLIGSIKIMMKVTAKIYKPAYYLLLPYLLWVIFAAVLNYLSVF